jgi:hypothetical protein
VLSSKANGRGAFGGLRFSMLDLRLGGRMLVKHPALTVIGTIAVAFAIAVGTVGFEIARQAFWPKPGGTGIGLTLARQIAEAHDGALTLSNRSGAARGTIARLRLPAG